MQQDLVTTTNQPQMVTPANFPYTSRDGYIRNVATNMNLRPSAAPTRACPAEYDELRLAGTNNDTTYRVRWVQVEGHIG